LQNFFVGPGRGGKFAFRVKFVGRVEIGGDIANNKVKILRQPT
jgi:hypothetical protein